MEHINWNESNFVTIREGCAPLPYTRGYAVMEGFLIGGLVGQMIFLTTTTQSLAKLSISIIGCWGPVRVRCLDEESSSNKEVSRLLIAAWHVEGVASSARRV